MPCLPLLLSNILNCTYNSSSLLKFVISSFSSTLLNFVPFIHPCSFFVVLLCLLFHYVSTISPVCLKWGKISSYLNCLNVTIKIKWKNQLNWRIDLKWKRIKQRWKWNQGTIIITKLKKMLILPLCKNHFRPLPYFCDSMCRIIFLKCQYITQSENFKWTT